MRLSINIKPKCITDISKGAVIRRLQGDKVCITSEHGTYLANFFISERKKGDVRVYNVEKRRKRVKRTIANGVRASIVESKTHWVGYYYDIPMSLIKELGIKVVQKSRHFVVVQK